MRQRFRLLTRTLTKYTVYDQEPDEVYIECVTKLISEGKVKRR